MGPKGGGGGGSVGPPPATSLADLGLSDSAHHDFAASLKDVVAARVIAAVPSPYLFALARKVAKLSFLHLCLAYGVTVDGYLPPIWEKVA